MTTGVAYRLLDPQGKVVFEGLGRWTDEEFVPHELVEDEFSHLSKEINDNNRHDVKIDKFTPPKNHPFEIVEFNLHWDGPEFTVTVINRTVIENK